jgi:hypothetical protein
LPEGAVPRISPPVDHRARLVNETEIPEADAVADFVVFLSVFTYLKEKESCRYLQEAKRVLKEKRNHRRFFFGTEHRNACLSRWNVLDAGPVVEAAF